MRNLARCGPYDASVNARADRRLRPAGPGPRARWASGGIASLALALAIALSCLTFSGAGAIEAPPPTPVNGKPSPFVTDLSTPKPSPEAPSVRAPVGVLADLDSGQVLFSKGLNDARPIASVTKLMTALITIERSALDEVVTVSPNAAPRVTGYHGSELDLRPGERISVEDLLTAALIQSANDAAVALAEHVGGSVDRFVSMMNRRARRLGMRDTSFASSSGLDDAGRSTARDLLVLTREVMEQASLARIVRTKFAEIPSPEGKARRVQNRNVLLWLYPGAIGVKTGYTVGARFCLVAAAERDGLRLVSIVLGAPTPEGQFSDSATLLNYGFAAFERRTFVDEGELLGSLRLPGGSVSGRTEGSLDALIPSADLGQVERRFVPAGGVAFPPEPGEVIGELEVAAGPLDLGTVPVVVSEVPPPPPADDGPWWRRTLSSVGDAVGGLVGGLLG